MPSRFYRSSRVCVRAHLPIVCCSEVSGLEHDFGGPPLFVFVMTKTHYYQGKTLKFFRLSEYYDIGIARLNRQWSSLDEGRGFGDRDHFYATDLDLFGHGSLFQLICSARTQTGRATLATWLKAPASREEVLARHAAIAELSGRHDLCEALAAAGAVKASDCRPETFQT